MNRLLAIMTATTVLVSAFATSAQADEVHVLNWKGYGADEPGPSKPSRRRRDTRSSTTSSTQSRRC